MPQTPSDKKATANQGSYVQRGLREASLILFAALGIYLLLSLASYDMADPAWSHSTSAETVNNIGGVFGAWFADVFLFLFGYLAFLFPLAVMGMGWLLYRGGQAPSPPAQAGQQLVRALGFGLVLVAGTALLSLHLPLAENTLPAAAGGLLGSLVAQWLVAAFNILGSTLFSLALLLIGISLFSGLSWLKLMDLTGQACFRAFAATRAWLRERRAARQARKERKKTVVAEQRKQSKRKAPKIAKPADKAIPTLSERVEKEKQMPLFEAPPDVSLPALSLLDAPVASKKKMSSAALEAMARQVELKLKDFGIEAEVVAVYPGPVITRFELQPAPGIKGSQISNLAKDLARSLSVISVRVVDVIPGKSVIGLEIPNEHREIVRLVEILRSEEYEQAGSPLTLALGKDIGGHPVVADLARMPHLLVAGTTGSGKSVAINAMILSLLYNAMPSQVRLIMIDPKMLELSVYDDIPHLLTPVVTDMKEAATALRWCVAEMERRYKLMAALGVRNIGGFNRKVKQAKDSKQPLTDPLFQPQREGDEAPLLEPLPFIVVIVDELADMMMVVGKKVEEYIARLAQKARAAGIHLILATQRPSVDVLTGLIKANIPTRIAFQVSSKIDSRTIIDQMGAETLLGHGDMLYVPPGSGVPVRVHGAFVDDHEVHNVVEDLKKRAKPDYDPAILAGDTLAGEGAGLAGEGEDSEADPLYDEAVNIVIETRRASISSVQRRLKIGYNRAARMIEAMEQAGVVSPPQSNGQREVLVPKPEP